MLGVVVMLIQRGGRHHREGAADGRPTPPISEEMSSTEEVAPGRLTADQERAMYLGVARTRRVMLAGREDALATVEVERHLVLLAGRGFDRAVCGARAEGLSLSSRVVDDHYE